MQKKKARKQKRKTGAGHDYSEANKLIIGFRVELRFHV